jgi:hypothetical protein
MGDHDDLESVITIAWNAHSAADAHDCIMVRVLGPTEYKVVARLIRAPAPRAPL